MLQDLLGETGGYIAQFLLALIFVLALIFLVTWAIRRYGIASMVPGSNQKGPRLQVVESLALDAKRRLVLVRRDGMEHLVLIGGGDDLVVERSILNGLSLDLRRLTLEARGQDATTAPAPARPTPASSAPVPAPARTEAPALAEEPATAPSGLTARTAAVIAGSAAAATAGVTATGSAFADRFKSPFHRQSAQSTPPASPIISEPPATIPAPHTLEDEALDDPLDETYSESDTLPETQKPAASVPNTDDLLMESLDAALTDELDLLGDDDETDAPEMNPLDDEAAENAAEEDGEDASLGDEATPQALDDLDLENAFEEAFAEAEAELAVAPEPEVLPEPEAGAPQQPPALSDADLLAALVEETPPLASEAPLPIPPRSTMAPRPAAPIVMRPPSRGPAASATTLPATDKPLAPPEPVIQKPEATSSDPYMDLDDEMERLLGEISGSSKKPRT